MLAKRLKHNELMNSSDSGNYIRLSDDAKIYLAALKKRFGYTKNSEFFNTMITRIAKQEGITLEQAIELAKKTNPPKKSK